MTDPIMSWARAVAAAASLLLMSSCGFSGGTPYEWTLPPGFPKPQVPEGSTLTREKVELGRHLFYDKRLSANATQSCASCHQQARAFSDAAATATGSTGQKHHRNSMALVNVAYSATLTWAHPGITTLEQHTLLPLFGDAPIEMGAAGHEEEILSRLRADERYAQLFSRAFPFELNRIRFDNIVEALASFTRTLVSFNSPFDRYAYHGEDSALSEAQLRGMGLFMSERLECAHCHSGFNFSQFVTHESATVAERAFHVTGLYPASEVYAAGVDYGLFSVTGNVADKDRFKAPTLRNVALTAPYMHDGSLATLEDVIDFYAAGGRVLSDGPRAGDGRAHPSKSPFIRGFTLTDDEKRDLLDFLSSLTDPQFVTDERFSDPFATSARR